MAPSRSTSTSTGPSATQGGADVGNAAQAVVRAWWLWHRWCGRLATAKTWANPGRRRCDGARRPGCSRVAPWPSPPWLSSPPPGCPRRPGFAGPLLVCWQRFFLAPWPAVGVSSSPAALRPLLSNRSTSHPRWPDCTGGLQAPHRHVLHPRQVRRPSLAARRASAPSPAGTHAILGGARVAARRSRWRARMV